ncbi:MAG: ABC transporter ATP-binding protein [Lachnospiraceae bacterium]
MRKKNQSYSLWSNYVYTFKEMRKLEGAGAIVLCVASAILQIVQPFLMMVLPSVAVALMTSGKKPGILLFLLVGYVLLLQLLRLITGYVESKCNSMLFLFRIDSVDTFHESCLKIDYQLMESEEGKKKMDGSLRNVYSGNESGIEAFVKNLIQAMVFFGGMLVYAFLIGTLQPLLLLLIALLTGIVTLVNTRAEKKGRKINETEFWKAYREMQYLNAETLNTANGKDIRLYRMKRWFSEEFQNIIGKLAGADQREQNQYLAARMTERVLALFRDAFVYAYLIWQMAQGNMEVSAFLLYAGIAAGFGGLMSGFSTRMQGILRDNRLMREHREFVELAERQGTGTEQLAAAGLLHEIRFEHVSYCYEGQEENTVKDVTLTIKPGEKLALVGMNGAGKTTLIKLLCGLYHPTAGTIYIDGQDSSTLSKKEYYKEFSVVFQDVFAFAFPLSDNVSCRRQEDTDKLRLKSCLKRAGLWEKVQSLPKREETILNKDLDAEGVVLSGGEMQKLMLARALYKDAPVVILDEPTAALDPIAESSLYEKYYEMTKDKTSIFISHRLSSTRFCDRILFMENGRITEEGSHEELMLRKGAYANMYEVQARYYKNKQQEEECYA